MEKNKIKKSVGDFYKKVASGEIMVDGDKEDLNKALGYSEEDLKAIPEEANQGLGCGNPLEIGEAKPGDTVLDLGSGKGMDAFLAAKKVGENGRVIGVDMTPEMVSKAREIAKKRKFQNVEFRLGEIEYLPVPDNTCDLVISNCVINLSTEKEQVYREIFRVLKPGGRIGISDTTNYKRLPDEVINDPTLYGTWVAGASSPEDIREMLENAGFIDIVLDTKNISEEYAKKWGITYLKLSEYMTKTLYSAKKPE